MRLCAELPTAGSLDVNLETAMLSCIACRCLIKQLQLQDTQRSAPAAVHYKLCCTCSGPQLTCTWYRWESDVNVYSQVMSPRQIDCCLQDSTAEQMVAATQPEDGSASTAPAAVHATQLLANACTLWRRGACCLSIGDQHSQHCLQDAPWPPHPLTGTRKPRVASTSNLEALQAESLAKGCSGQRT